MYLNAVILKEGNVLGLKEMVQDTSASTISNYTTKISEIEVSPETYELVQRLQKAFGESSAAFVSLNFHKSYLSSATIDDRSIGSNRLQRKLYEGVFEKINNAMGLEEAIGERKYFGMSEITQLAKLAEDKQISKVGMFGAFGRVIRKRDASPEGSSRF